MSSWALAAACWPNHADGEPAATGLTCPTPEGAIISARMLSTASLKAGIVIITATSATIFRLSYAIGIFSTKLATWQVRIA